MSRIVIIYDARVLVRVVRSMADTPGLNDIRLYHKPPSPVVISCALSDKDMYERFFGNEQRTSTTSRLRNGAHRRARSPDLRSGSADVIFFTLEQEFADSDIRVIGSDPAPV